MTPLRTLAILALTAISDTNSGSALAFQLAPNHSPLARRRITVPRVSTPNVKMDLQTPRAFPITALRISDMNDADTAEEDLTMRGIEVEDTAAELPTVSNERDIKQNHNSPDVNISTMIKQAFLPGLVFLLPLFLTSFPDSAWAARSGGRMGGSSGRSSSYGGSSRSYSAPGRSYGGGNYGGGYSRGYSSYRPNVIVSPGISPFYSPFSNPLYSPYSYGGSGVVVSRGPSFGMPIFFFAMFAFVALSTVGNIGNSVSDSVSNTIGGGVQSALGSGVSVVEISVALNVPDRDSPNSILTTLERLARTARTDSRVGLQNLTSQTALELMRRKEDIVAASTQGYNFKDDAKAQREFNNMSIEQRSKFQSETVSNYGGVDYSAKRKSLPSSEYSPKATVAVVTMVLLIDGDVTSKLLSSKVNSVRDVTDALNRIAADAKADECLRGAEILWTPEERDETLTMRDVLEDYSTLRTV